MSADNLALVRRFFESFLAEDWDRFYGCLSPDIVWHIGEGAGAGTVPYFGVFRGIDAVRGCMAAYDASPIEEPKFEMTEFFGSEDRVFAFGDADYFMPPTNRRFSTPMLYAFRIGGGAILEMHRFLDSSVFVKAYEEKNSA